MKKSKKPIEQQSPIEQEISSQPAAEVQAIVDAQPTVDSGVVEGAQPTVSEAKRELCRLGGECSDFFIVGAAR